MAYDEGLLERLREAVEGVPGLEDDEGMQYWVRKGLEYAGSLPTK